MPELYDPVPSSPQINVLYSAPGHEVVSTEQLKEPNLETIAIGGGGPSGENIADHVCEIWHPCFAHRSEDLEKS